jgi:uncharacterized protein (UPF0332 family)
MPEKVLKRLEREGKVRKQKAGFIQIEALLKEAIRDLEEGEKIKSIAERATYLMAYMAMLKAGRALMLLKGYVPDDGAQHKTVVDVTTEVLGPKYRSLTEQFETMRRKRNDLTYGTGTLLSKTEAQSAFSDAIRLTRGILKEVKSQNPQMELMFDLDEK